MPRLPSQALHAPFTRNQVTSAAATLRANLGGK